MTERYPRIRVYKCIEEEDYLHVRESVSICFYMQRSHAEVAQAVLHALDIYSRAVGPRTLGWYPDDEGDWRELDENGWALNRERLLHPSAASLELHERPDATTGYMFSYWGCSRDDTARLDRHPGAVCAVSFWLPTEYLEAHGPGHVRGLALELAEGLPFNSGHTGLSFHYEGRIFGTTRPVRELCFRYPGMDIPALNNINSIHWTLGTRVNGVHWLNFLGQPVLGELGGAAGLHSLLHSPDVAVQELKGERAIVTLGPWPEAGDTAHGHTLPHYRELARVLEPWLYEDRSRWGGFTGEDQHRWYRRFLD